MKIGVFCPIGNNGWLLSENAGFFPGDNLIISMETSGTPLSSKVVEKIARHYLFWLYNRCEIRTRTPMEKN